MASVLGPDRDFNYKETELCLGLPGGVKNDVAPPPETPKAGNKRGFAETVDLKLNLQAKEGSVDLNDSLGNASKDKNHLPAAIKDPAKPPAK
ncbi:hypothetical protein Tsubulata_012549 [Turnera subulata]|uniref:Auxin-responsive protein n=1 Tax=Turnera subulata TaxID=218843 RepID=A0A9Q0GCP1_9ROSI|nr:hypothetical protein Tsubulata_012549 [Turnera subulata]